MGILEGKMKFKKKLLLVIAILIIIIRIDKTTGYAGET